MTVLDVATAQQLLTQAEVDNAVAHVNVWRAMLLVTRAAGDLQPFFSIYRNTVRRS
jgi:outer membrane protein